MRDGVREECGTQTGEVQCKYSQGTDFELIHIQNSDEKLGRPCGVSCLLGIHHLVYSNVFGIREMPTLDRQISLILRHRYLIIFPQKNIAQIHKCSQASSNVSYGTTIVYLSSMVEMCGTK